MDLVERSVENGWIKSGWVFFCGFGRNALFVGEGREGKVLARVNAVKKVKSADRLGICRHASSRYWFVPAVDSELALSYDRTIG